MPRGDPFSELCRQAALLAQPIAADLHTHTLASDGDYTPSQVLAFAQQAKLKVVAITDHDTLAGYDSAPVQDFRVRLVPGVELTTRWQGRDTHLLGLGFDPESPAIRELLERQCELRRERFRQMIDKLGLNVELPVDVPSWGRRHLAKALVRTGAARNLHDAFQRLLVPMGAPPCEWISIEEGLRILREAGGTAALAHPGDSVTEADLTELQRKGMNAVETSHPRIGVARSGQLRQWASRLGLFVTGGSDCHGPGTPAIGSHGLRNDEWNRLDSDQPLREIAAH